MRVRGAGLAGLAVVLVLFLSGCTASTGSDLAPAVAPASGTTVAAPDDPGADVGNTRPVVSFDGQMVRRRVVVAIRLRPDANVNSLRTALDSAARKSQLDLTDVSPNVLSPDQLTRWVPELTLAVPPPATLESATALIGDARSSFPEIAEYTVENVLVHDLEFRLPVAPSDAVTIAGEIDLEGIVWDALGSYDGAADGDAVRIRYTGPLLSDDLVEQVRSGIARPAGADATAVTVGPRTAGGKGVVMADEPAEVITVAAVVDEDAGHGHDTLAAARGGVLAGAGWLPFGIAVLVVSLLTLLAVRLRRRGQRGADRPVAHRSGESAAVKWENSLE